MTNIQVICLVFHLTKPKELSHPNKIKQLYMKDEFMKYLKEERKKERKRNMNNRSPDVLG